MLHNNQAENTLIDDETPIFTVIIVTYNHAKYIRKSIESILTQKTKYSYEIVVIDDASNDGTQEILKQYQDNNDGIRLFLSNKNYGRASIAATEMGVTVTSKYLAYLDGDDYWIDEHKIEKQIRFLENEAEYVGACHSYQLLLVNENNKIKIAPTPGLREWNIEDFVKGEYSLYCHTSTWIWRNIYKTPWPPTMVQRELFGDPILASFYIKHGKVKYFDDVMTCYRIHNESSWNSLTEKQRDKLNVDLYLKINQALDSKYEKMLLAHYRRSLRNYRFKHVHPFKLLCRLLMYTGLDKFITKQYRLFRRMIKVIM